jgi:hypothetical protein
VLATNRNPTGLLSIIVGHLSYINNECFTIFFILPQPPKLEVLLWFTWMIQLVAEVVKKPYSGK